MAFHRLLVANRGEIAVRILRTAREMGLSTVAVYSEADAGAIHLRHADTCVCIGPAEPSASYLNVEALIEAARSTGADAIHPGYGFLSENAAFAQAVHDAHLCWVGPSPASIAAMGDKVAARRIARQAGVPCVPGIESEDLGELASVGFPLLLKAAGGGGGKGMRLVLEPADLPEALEAARGEAGRAFGNRMVYAERYLSKARHVEVQVLGDIHGNRVHLFERDCSLQRRHQKVVEEAPAPGLSAATREGLYAAALALAGAVSYHSAGTIEFLVAEDGSFYFLEMNTRIQVEHTVTEAITGLDLVREQIRIARGEALGYGQKSLGIHGHAIQCRLYAEDPAQGFMPSPGVLRAWKLPEGPGVRVDAGVEQGSEVPVWYDPLLAKLVAWAPDREAARRRMARMLEETVVVGVATGAEYLGEVMHHPRFAAADLHTGFLGEHFGNWRPPEVDPVVFAAAWAASQRQGTVTPVEAVTTPWSGLGAWRLA